MSNKVVVVVPVLNNLFYTKQFLKSLERQTFKNFSVIVVDNGSTDGTLDWLAKEWLQFDGSIPKSERYVHTNSTNRGYAGGCNDGLSMRDTYFPDSDVLICNNDMEFYPTCIEELVKAADAYRIVGKSGQRPAGIFGGRLLFPDTRIQHGGAFINVFGWGQHKLAGALDADVEESEPVGQEFVTGALFYITKECLAAVPKFDERFCPAYFEETDYCVTARAAGFGTYYVPRAKAIHYESKTSNDVLGDAQRVSDLSRAQQQKFYLKHDKSAADYQPTSDRRALLMGKIYGDWSFSIVLRNLAKGLAANGVDVSIAPEEYHQPMNMEDWEIKEMIQKPNDYWNRVVLRSAEGDHQYLMPPGVRRVAHTTFEGTRPHNQWIDQLNAVDAVVTNSSFCKNLLEERGVRSPISIVPNPVDVSHFTPDAHPLEIEQRRGFGFLLMGAYGERKNIEMAIRAFIAEFKPGEDVFLSVHLLSLFYILQQKKTDVKGWIRNEVLGGRELPHAPIFVTGISMHPSIVPRMLRAHQCFLMPSRCEGFGNGIVEAAACGVPSVATNYSGMTDFLDPDVSFPLDYKLEAMPLQVLPYFRNYIGSQWATPSEDHMRFLMRQAFSDQEETRKKGERARQKALAYDVIPVGARLASAMFD